MNIKPEPEISIKKVEKPSKPVISFKPKAVPRVSPPLESPSLPAASSEPATGGGDRGDRQEHKEGGGRGRGGDRSHRGRDNIHRGGRGGGGGDRGRGRGGGRGRGRGGYMDIQSGGVAFGGGTAEREAPRKKVVDFGSAEARAAAREKDELLGRLKSEPSDNIREVAKPSMMEMDYDDSDNNDGGDDYGFTFDNMRPVTLPYVKAEGEEGSRLLQEAKDMLHISNDDDVFFVQLPSSIPISTKSSEDTRKTKEKNRFSSDSPSDAPFEDELRKLPTGLLGKLRTHASGKVTMKIGEIVFDVTPGLPCQFFQEVWAIDHTKKQACVLGKLQKRLVVVPDIDCLVADYGK